MHAISETVIQAAVRMKNVKDPSFFSSFGVIDVYGPSKNTQVHNHLKNMISIVYMGKIVRSAHLFFGSIPKFSLSCKQTLILIIKHENFHLV